MSYTRYERARILGARSLQLAQGAPAFVDTEEGDAPLEISKRELREGKLPITVR
ncbi:DNA-directed RNA polymerase subunit K [Candidatus Nanosalina sp. VS9-1]|uniref:DNA-directed RNA polymerase subunit K n=1 Tax=Candidatus Nanosalina sp. VS9-1 TaxID=3388566 RepID=UPI0039E1CCA7